MIMLRLNHNTDQDLLKALEGERSKSGRIKELARLGLEAEKQSK